MELGIYVAYEERKIGIEFGVSGVKVKVKVTVTKNRKNGFWLITSVRIDILV